MYICAPGFRCLGRRPLTGRPRRLQRRPQTSPEKSRVLLPGKKYSFHVYTYTAEVFYFILGLYHRVVRIVLSIYFFFF